jgi:hypothetical protein
VNVRIGAGIFFLAVAFVIYMVLLGVSLSTALSVMAIAVLGVTGACSIISGMTAPKPWSYDPPDQGCTLPPPHWYCSRKPGHDGPCAARPR